jgi:hypothetical protein
VTFQATDWFLLSPELFLTAAGLLLLALAAFLGKEKDEFVGFLSFLAIGVTRPGRPARSWRECSWWTTSPSSSSS